MRRRDRSVDAENATVTLSGELALPGAGGYAEGLGFLKDVELDAATGGKDELALNGTFALDGPAPARLFDHDTETVRGRPVARRARAGGESRGALRPGRGGRAVGALRH